MISRLGAAVFLSFFFFGCSDFLKSKKSETEVIQVETQLSCLNEIKGNIVKVFNSNLKESEISQSFNCIDMALSKFQEKFRGHEKEEEFSTQEVTSLLNFFYKDLKITEEMTTHLLKVKHAMVGGSKNSLSKDDIESLKVILIEMNKEFIQLSPHFIVFHNQKQLYSEKNIRMSYEQLRMSIGRIIKFSKISKAQYTAHDLFDFLKSFKFELGRFSGDEEKMVAIFEFLSGQHQSITSETYSDIAQSLIDLIEVRALIANKHMPIDVNLTALKNRGLEKFLVNIVRLLSQTPAVKAKQNLEISKLEPLFPMSFQQGDFQMQIPFELLKSAKILVLGGDQQSITALELESFQKRIGTLLMTASLLSAKFEKLMTGENPISEESLSDIHDTFVDAFDIIFYDDALVQSGGSEKVFEKILSAFKAIEFQKSDLISVLFEELFTASGFESEERVIQTLGQTIRLISSWQKINDKMKTNDIRFSDLSDLLTNVNLHLKLQNKSSVYLDRIFRSALISDPVLSRHLKSLQLFFPDLSVRQVSSLTFDRLAQFFKGLDLLVQVPFRKLSTLDFMKMDERELVQLISKTDFLSSRHSSHYLISYIFDQFSHLDLTVRNQIVSFLKIVVAERPIEDLESLLSIVSTLKRADLLFKEFSHASRFDVEHFKAVLNFLESSDQMQVKSEMDLVGLMNVLDPYFVAAKLNPAKLMKMYEKFFAQNPRQFKKQQIEQAKKYMQMTTDLQSITDEIQKLVHSEKIGAEPIKSVMTKLEKLTRMAAEFPLFKNEKSEIDMQDVISMVSETISVQLQIPDWLKRVKILLVGGDRSKVKLSELHQFLLILGAIHSEIDQIEKPLHTLISLESANLEDIKVSGDLLKVAIRKILPLTNIAKSGASFNEFSEQLAPKLFSQLDEDSFDRTIELMESIHDFLLGDVEISDSDGAVQLAFSYIDIFQIFRMAISGHMTLEIQSRPQILNTIGTVQEILDMIRQTPSMKVSGHVSLKELDHVVGSLIKQKKFPIPVSQNVFTDFYRKMLQRVFVTKGDRDFQKDLLSQQIFDRIHAELEIVHEIVSALDAGFNGVDPKKVYEKRIDNYNESESIRARIGASLAKKAQKWIQENSEIRRNQARAIQIYLSEFLAKPSVHFSNGYLLSRNYLEYKSTWIGHFRGFYTRTLARLLIQGWGETEKNTIGGNGLTGWYSDFRTYAVAIKTFDPRTGNGGERSLLEANLFTIDGNGDDQMTYREAVQYVALLTTGGGIQFKNLWQLLEANKCLTSEADPFGLVYVQENCALDVLAANHEQLYYNMNGFNGFMAWLGDHAEKRRYFQTVLDIARTDQNKKGKLVESVDLRTVNMLIGYVESVLTALDLDGNSRLSIKELRAGYPRFEKLIFGFAKKTKSEDLKAFSQDVFDIRRPWTKVIGITAVIGKFCRKSNVPQEVNERWLAQESFIYLLLNGHMNIEWTDSMIECVFKDGPVKLEGEVDRLELINAFKVLKSVLTSGP